VPWRVWRRICRHRREDGSPLWHRTESPSIDLVKLDISHKTVWSPLETSRAPNLPAGRACSRRAFSCGRVCSGRFPFKNLALFWAEVHGRAAFDGTVSLRGFLAGLPANIAPLIVNRPAVQVYRTGIPLLMGAGCVRTTKLKITSIERLANWRCCTNTTRSVA
jgi:hypothetical protein